MKRRSIAGLAACLCLGTNGVHANPEIRINGFATAGAAVSDSEVSYLGKITDSVTFEKDTVLGIQLDGTVSDKVNITAQLLASGDNEGGESAYNVDADWAFLGYQFNDQLTMRGGRIKFPIYLVSDYVEVGYAYPWIRPPQEVYKGVPLNAISGVDAVANVQAGQFDVLFQPYFGSNEERSEPTPGFEIDADMQEVAGLNISASTDILTLRAGYMQTKITSDVIATPDDLPPAAQAALSGSAMDNDDASLWGVGLNLNWRNLVAYSEYTETEIDGPLADNTAWYATLGYRLGSGKYLVHYTYADLDTDEDTQLARKQHSSTLGLRYDFHRGTALKVEWQRIEPQDGTSGLFEGDPGEDVDVFSIAVDAVF